MGRPKLMESAVSLKHLLFVVLGAAAVTAAAVFIGEKVAPGSTNTVLNKFS